MRKIALLFLIAIFGTVQAASTANVTITFSILAVNDIAFSGNPAPFSVTPGTPAIDNSTTYSVTTNATNQIISAVLDSNMPSGVTLTVDLQAPTGATSLGPVSLSTVSADLVTGITQVQQTGLTVTYTITATVTAAIVANATRTITYTIAS